MEFSYTETSVKKKDIDLPAYIKFGDKYTKIINDTDLLMVENWPWNFGIEVGILSQNNPFGNEGWKFITEDEFNNVLQTVKEKLAKYIP